MTQPGKLQNSIDTVAILKFYFIEANRNGVPFSPPTSGQHRFDPVCCCAVCKVVKTTRELYNNLLLPFSPSIRLLTTAAANVKCFVLNIARRRNGNERGTIKLA